jgi:hypothetical protein
MEQGIASAGGGGVLIVNESNDTLDKTWQEISDAGFSVLHSQYDEQLLQMWCAEDEGDYLVTYWTFGLAEPILFIASSASAYPVRDAGN